MVGTWFARAGAVAVLLGAAFGFAYAVERGLIGPAARVAIGLASGVAFIVAGERAVRHRWPRLGQALAGGGVGLLYLSLWAAFARYGLLSAVPMFALLTGVAIAGVVLALRHDSEVLAVLALGGGFLNPYVTGIDRMTAALFGYVLLLDLGVVALVARRRWVGLEASAVVATWSVVLLGIDAGRTAVVQGFATVFFLVFAARAMVAGIAPRRAEGGADVSLDVWLLTLNSMAYFGVGMLVLDGVRGEFSVALGIAHLAAGLLARDRAADDRPLWLTLLGLGTLFLTVAVPIELDGPIVAIVWAVEGVILVWLGRATGMVAARVSGLAVVALSLLASVAVEFAFGAGYRPDRLLLSVESLTLAIQVAALGVTAWLLAHAAGTDPEAATALAVGANVLALLWLSFEAAAAFGHPSSVVDVEGYRTLQFTYSAIWALYAAAVLAAGIVWRVRWARLLAVALFAVVAAKLVVADLWLLQPLHRMVGFTGLGLLLLLGSLLYHRFRDVVVTGR